MSHNLVFYKVSRVAEELPDIINTDNTELPYYDVRTEHAADWEKEIGTVRTIEYSIVDQYAASEKLFGKRPQSIGTFPEYYLNPDSIWAQLELVFPDGEKSSSIEVKWRNSGPIGNTRRTSTAGMKSPGWIRAIRLNRKRMRVSRCRNKRY